MGSCDDLGAKKHRWNKRLGWYHVDKDQYAKDSLKLILLEEEKPSSNVDSNVESVSIEIKLHLINDPCLVARVAIVSIQEYSRF